MAFAARIYVAETGHGRSAERVAVGVPATVRDGDAVAHDAVVHDVSATGCLVETDAYAPIGTQLTIGIAGIGRVPAEVVRQEARGLGCSFLAPVDRALLARVRETETIVPWSMPVPPRPESTMPDPARWQRGARLLLVLGSSAGLWAAIIGVARLL